MKTMHISELDELLKHANLFVPSDEQVLIHFDRLSLPEYNKESKPIDKNIVYNI